jgi:receptor expression-enhancing protein 1/2/3/4
VIVTTSLGALFPLPEAMTYMLFYTLFRLVFGTLYPAYASYKAVRTKNVKEYVSRISLYTSFYECVARAVEISAPPW